MLCIQFYGLYFVRPLILIRMRRYAFIDVPNTTGTAREVLGFAIDWRRLYEFLTSERWSCSGIFFYKGHSGEAEKEQLRSLSSLGYIVQTKLTHVHPGRVKDIQIRCPECHELFLYRQSVKGHRKSNCDVELTVDALETLSASDEALLFTGDGDFAYLIETLLEKGVTVRLVSSKNRDRFGKRRFSTRLSKILDQEESGTHRVQFIHLKNWQKRIEDLREIEENRHEA